MSGMNRITGAHIAPEPHLVQSIGDILSTPCGTRVMRRDYGSELPRLVDAPINADTLMDIYMATAEALTRWEPRLQLSRVQVEGAQAGQLVVALEGETADGQVRIAAGVGGQA